VEPSDSEAVWQSGRWVVPDTVKARRAREKRNQLFLDSDCVMLPDYLLQIKQSEKPIVKFCGMCRNRRRFQAISPGQQRR